MTDDIVTRLRGQVACDHDKCEDCDLLADAADEIERLRGILNHICDVWASDLYSITNEIKEIRKQLNSE